MYAGRLRKTRTLNGGARRGGGGKKWEEKIFPSWHGISASFSPGHPNVGSVLQKSIVAQGPLTMCNISVNRRSLFFDQEGGHSTQRRNGFHEQTFGDCPIRSLKVAVILRVSKRKVIDLQKLQPWNFLLKPLESFMEHPKKYWQFLRNAGKYLETSRCLNSIHTNKVFQQLSHTTRPKIEIAEENYLRKSRSQATNSTIRWAYIAVVSPESSFHA